MPRLKFASSQRLTLELLLVVVVALAGAPRMCAEGKAGGQQNQQPAAQPQQPGQPSDQATPDSGGPSGDTGVIAVPKKKENPDEAPPPPLDGPGVVSL